MNRFILFTVLILLVFLASLSLATIPKLINYQGMLTDNSGTPLTDTLNITFKIYDDPSAGNKKWEETQSNVPVINGLFNVILGSVTPIDTLSFNQDYWLDITVDAEHMPSRLRFTSVGYAYRASIADSATVAVSAPNGGGWTDDGSIVRLTTSTDNVGIGTSSPQDNLHVANHIRVGADATYPTVYGEIKHDGSGTGFIINANAGGGGWADLHFQTNRTTKMFIESGGNVGIGTTSPTNKLQVDGGTNTAIYATSSSGRGMYGSSGTGYGVHGTSNSTFGVFGESDSGSGVYGESSSNYGYGVGGYSSSGSGVHGSSGTGYGVYGYSASGDGVYGYRAGGGNYAGYFLGNVRVTGTLSKGGGSFVIDHPLDPANKYLYHSFVESPDMMNIYNGNVNTDANGDATITLPDYFEALNRDFRYQLTVIGQFAQAIINEKINNNRFTIKTDKPNVEVSWQVTGIRHDPFAEGHRIQVEVQKTGAESGKYLHPKEYGVSETLGIDYEKTHEIEENMKAREFQQQLEQEKMKAESLKVQTEPEKK